MSNPLLSSLPELYQQALSAGNSSEDLANITTGSQKELTWLGPCNHLWPAKVASRTRKSGGTGCPFCSGNTVLEGFNDLKTKNPELAKQWHPTKNGSLSPQNVTSSSKTKVWWVGPCLHDWEAEVGSRNSGRGCGFCSGNEVLAGFNDLKTTHPEVATKISPLSPIQATDVSFGSGKKPLWRFGCEHDFDASVASVIRGSSCPYCSGHRLLKGFNDLASKKPELVDEWDSEKNSLTQVDEVSYGSNFKAWWYKKSCGHSWQALVYNRYKGDGCSVCAGKVVTPGVNDISTIYPQLLVDWDYESNKALPTELTWGTKEKVFFICELGHSWDTNPSTRVKRNLGCPYCSRRKLLKGFNDFSLICKDAASQWDYQKNSGHEPSEFLPGSIQKFWFQCKKGHSWKASLFARYHNASGCPECAETGFNPGKEGTVYFLKNDALMSYKVGITNTFANVSRIKQFEGKGWKLLSRWDFRDGSNAYETEQLFFIWLREEVGLGPSCSRADLMGMSGYTETFTSGVLRQQSVISMLDKLSLQVGVR
jgi:DNA-directed RNA polymerase subunit RPC12/RpoP